MQQLRFVIVAMLASGTATAAPVHAHLTITGTAGFLYARKIVGAGLVRLTVSGVGETGDACGEGKSRQFTATFVGEIQVADDGTFVSELAPVEPAARAGCAMETLHVDEVTDIVIDARIGELWGSGIIAPSDTAEGEVPTLRAQIIFTPAPESGRA